MAEWSMAVVLKTTEPGRVPGVRIPLPPPSACAAGEALNNKEEQRVMNKTYLAAAIAVCTIGAVSTVLAQRPAANMSFFVTSSNPKGGNLGGLSGGDAVCQSLAQAAGAGGKTWHAYLSSSTVDAKTRIGKGPWYNFKGDLIAQNVNDLLAADKNKISAKTALTEKGTTPNYLAVGADGKAAPVAQPLQHD